MTVWNILSALWLTKKNSPVFKPLLKCPVQDEALNISLCSTNAVLSKNCMKHYMMIKKCNMSHFLGLPPNI